MRNRAARRFANGVAFTRWLALFLCLGWSHSAVGQSLETLTPAQRDIYRQQQLLSSSSDEERRDALMRLGAMHLPDASRASLPCLTDASAKIRVIAAHAILSLPPSET